MVSFPHSWAQPLQSPADLSLSLFFGTHMGERMQSSQPLQSPADLFLFFGTHMGESMQSSQPLQSPPDLDLSLSLSLFFGTHMGERGCNPHKYINLVVSKPKQPWTLKPY